MSEAKIKIYTMDHCPYCLRAKALLTSKGIAFDEVPVSQDDDAAWIKLEKLSGMKTMPQIFAGEKLIGGFTELTELDGQGGLDAYK